MDRIFYKSDVEDAYSGNPVYVFDTSYLPSPEVIDYELFIPTLMQSLPNHPYVLVMFSCGLNKVPWLWGIKFLKAFLAHDSPTNNVDNLCKIIAVHESWFVKLITQILTNFSISTKSFRLNALFETSKKHRNLLTSCDSLSELSCYVEIPKLKLSLNIYKHDAELALTPKIDFKCPIVPIIHSDTQYSTKTDPVFLHHFYQIFHIVDLYGNKVPLIFHKPGNRLNTDILFQCMLRNQLLWINDWDLYCIASCFKKILMEVPGPLIPVDAVSLPMKDDLDYTLVTLNQIMSDDGRSAVLFHVLELLSKIADNTETTKHTPVSVAKCMCHALTHEAPSQQNKNRTAIGVRYIKSLILHWAKIRPLYQRRYSTVEHMVTGEDLRDDTIEDLYNLSHEITMDEEESADDESHRVQFNTSNILSGNASLAWQELPKNTPGQINRLPANPPLQSLSDISNVHLQWPPQKYKFERSLPPKPAPEEPEVPVLRKPVVRGRKVGELAKLFEERSEAMELLRNIA